MHVHCKCFCIDDRLSVIAAVEWAERSGADVMSSSVGYFSFDSTEERMQYRWLDGKTTFASQAVNRAVALGTVFLTASGNDGPTDSTLITPADADSVIAVGGAQVNVSVTEA